MSDILDLMQIFVIELGVDSVLWNFLSLINIVLLEFELVSDKRIRVSTLWKVAGTVNVNFEVQIFLSEKIISLINHKLIWQIFFICIAGVRAWLVPYLNLALLSAVTINRKNCGRQLILKLKPKRLQLQERLPYKKWIWWIPERIQSFILFR